MNIHIRPEQFDDYAAIAQLHTLAFGQFAEAELVERIRQSDRYRPNLSLVAVVDNQVGGHCWLSDIDWMRETTQSVLALAPIAVHPDWQRRGIGSALIESSLEQATGQGDIFVSVLGHAEFYGKFGFEPSTHYGIEPPFPGTESVFRIQRLNDETRDLSGRLIDSSTFEGV